MTGSYVVFETAGQAALKPFEVPAPKPGQVLVELDYTVVSAGTERALLLGLPNTAGEFPRHPGYCGIGPILAVGEEVTTARVGDRALVKYAGHRSHAIQQAAGLTLVTDDRVDSLDASFVIIAAMGLGGVRRLRLEVGESAMIIGLGLLGMFAVQAASLSGAIPAIVSDFDPARRELALNLGADHAFAPDDPELVQQIKELTGGRGVDGVVEVTGASVALQQALECVRREGRVSLLGCTRVSDHPLDFYRFVHHPGVTLLGAHNRARPEVESRPGNWTIRDDYQALLKLLAARRWQVRPIISEIVSPAVAPAVYSRLAEDPRPPLGIVFDWELVR